MDKKRSKEEVIVGKWNYSLNVMSNIVSKMRRGEQNYLEEEEALKYELDAFVSLSANHEEAINSKEYSETEWLGWKEKFYGREVISDFYFASYAKVRNRLKFESRFYQDGHLDIDKCKRYLAFEDKLPQWEIAVNTLIAGAEEDRLISLQDLQNLVFYCKKHFPIVFHKSIEDQLVDWKISIYELKEQVAPNAEASKLRPLLLEELQQRIIDYGRTVEYYEQEVITGKSLGAIFLKHQIHYLNT